MPADEVPVPSRAQELRVLELSADDTFAKVQIAADSGAPAPEQLEPCDHTHGWIRQRNLTRIKGRLPLPKGRRRALMRSKAVGVQADLFNASAGKLSQSFLRK